LPEVATLLKVADQTVYTMARKAEMPAFKVRGHLRLKRQDSDLWIEERKSAAAGRDNNPTHEPVSQYENERSTEEGSHE